MLPVLSARLCGWSGAKQQKQEMTLEQPDFIFIECRSPKRIVSGSRNFSASSNVDSRNTEQALFRQHSTKRAAHLQNYKTTLAVHGTGTRFNREKNSGGNPDENPDKNPDENPGQKPFKKSQ